MPVCQIRGKQCNEIYESLRQLQTKILTQQNESSYWLMPRVEYFVLFVFISVAFIQTSIIVLVL